MASQLRGRNVSEANTINLDLETIVSNVTGALREEVMGGRKYLVAPVTLIVPGVLNGSDGPGYYPADQVSVNPHDWNHFPIVKGHPVLNGNPVSARDPVILERDGLGFLYRSGYANKLHSEAWFDDEFTRNKAPDTYTNLLANLPVEVSTGLFLKKTPTQPDEQGKLPTFNGREYTFVTSAYKPDHLAVIENGVGACSCEDGCGVFNERLRIDPTSEELFTLYLNSDPTPSPTVNPLPNVHAARIQSPDKFEKDSFRTKTLTPGIQAVMAKHAKDGSMMIQSYHFDSKKFTAEQAKAWLRKHHVKNMGFEEATGDGKDAPTANELSHDQIRSQLSQMMKARCSQADPYCYIEYVFDDYFIYSMGGDLYRMDYSKSDAGVTLGSDDPVEVTAKISFTPEPEDNMAATNNMNDTQRTEIVTFLTTNCDCWKNDLQKSKATLHALTDDQLMTLHQNARAEVRRLEVEQAARQGFGLGPEVTHEEIVVVLNANKPGTPTQPKPAPAPTPKPAPTPAPNPTPKEPPVTSESRLTPDEQEAVDWAKSERARVRNELVTQLTANVADGPAKAQAQTIYQGMTVENLRALAAAQPVANQPNPYAHLPQVPMFQGAAVPTVNVDGSPAPSQPLETEEIEWNEGASERLVARLGR